MSGGDLFALITYFFGLPKFLPSLSFLKALPPIFLFTQFGISVYCCVSRYKEQSLSSSHCQLSWCLLHLWYLFCSVKNCGHPQSHLTLDLSSSRVNNTLGHMSTPAFSVDSELLRYFPGHADAFQILLYDVYPILSCSSRLSLWIAYILVYSLSWQSSSICTTCPSHFGLLSFMMRSVFSNCVCALHLSLLTLSFHEIPDPLFISGTCDVWLPVFSFCATVGGHNSAPYNCHSGHRHTSGHRHSSAAAEWITATMNV